MPLILAPEDDLHALAVMKALDIRGVSYSLFSTEQLLDISTASLSISNVEILFSIEQIDRELTLYDRGWLRRHPTPSLAQFDARDQTVLSREYRYFIIAILELASERVDWINSLEATHRINNKIYQLRIARDAGFNIPNSRLTTSPQAAKSFICAMGGEALIKGLTPMSWDEDGKSLSAFSSKVNEDHFAPYLSLPHYPLYLQEYVSKKYEVRILVMGKTYASMKIDSQKSIETAVDWRIGFMTGNVAGEAMEIPLLVKSKIQRFMILAGLATASLDFIVTELEEWVFLECNESGNFLFLESIDPTIHVLDMFSHFLTSDAPKNFEYRAGDNPVLFESVIESVVNAKRSAMDRRTEALLSQI